MIVNIQRRLVFEIWTAEQANIAVVAGKNYDGEVVIRWVAPPMPTNAPSHTITFDVPLPAAETARREDGGG